MTARGPSVAITYADFQFAFDDAAVGVLLSISAGLTTPSLVDALHELHRVTPLLGARPAWGLRARLVLGAIAAHEQITTASVDDARALNEYVRDAMTGTMNPGVFAAHVIGVGDERHVLLRAHHGLTDARGLVAVAESLGKILSRQEPSTFAPRVGPSARARAVRLARVREAARRENVPTSADTPAIAGGELPRRYGSSTRTLDGDTEARLLRGQAGVGAALIVATLRAVVETTEAPDRLVLIAPVDLRIALRDGHLPRLANLSSDVPLAFDTAALSREDVLVWMSGELTRYVEHMLHHPGRLLQDFFLERLIPMTAFRKLLKRAVRAPKTIPGLAYASFVGSLEGLGSAWPVPVRAIVLPTPMAFSSVPCALAQRTNGGLVISFGWNEGNTTTELAERFADATVRHLTALVATPNDAGGPVSAAGS